MRDETKREVARKPAPAGSYLDLIAWQKAMGLARFVYRLTASFPQQEMYGLTSQLRRAAVSVPSNIAEGQARGSRPDFTRFLHIAKWSLAEVDTQCRLACDLGFCQAAALEEACKHVEELQRILHGLIQSLNRKGRDG